MQITQWLGLEKKQVLYNKTPETANNSDVIKKVLQVSMPMWVKAISSSKGTLASTHSSICTALREPNCTRSLPPRRRGCYCTSKFCHVLCKTVCSV